MKRMFQCDDAVSPVIGVMLMLVVTIIIAAVVSGFAGGLMSGSEKAPAASFKTTIKNTGYWGTSYFEIRVLATDQPIPTKNIKLVTSWKSRDGYSNRTTITGPSPGAPNTITYAGTKTYHSPLGYGDGIPRPEGTSEYAGAPGAGTFWPGQHFGNYTLLAGTFMHNSPMGGSNGGYGVTADTPYQYTYGTQHTPTDIDAMMAILGSNWFHLRAGDVVNVKIIHIPSQKVIYDKDVVVEGA
ncbi:MAG: type IV pilin N-terminal domain-containing protein [Methanolinea sp.]|jgi:FlaG/FlaF family flagellin (archaellin)|nr:type IV pilin N-terminal domain-containing protein [Methanolinea sp.]